jgi:hypothetical protein
VPEANRCHTEPRLTGAVPNGQQTVLSYNRRLFPYHGTMAPFSERHHLMKPSVLPLFMVLLTSLSTTRAAEFFVAPNGDDAAPGTERRPFLTLEQARDAVRTLGDDVREDIIVSIKAGDYHVTKPLLLTEADSGRSGFKVIYRSADGVGRARLTGSRPVTGWTRHQGTVWKVGVDKGTVCHTLYEGERRLRKARFPSYEHDPELPCAAGPYLVSETGSPELPKGTRESWLTWHAKDTPPAAAYTNQLKVNVFPWGKCDWHRWICAVTDVDREARRITFHNQGDKTRIASRARYFLEDDLAFLNTPGEFFLDESASVLYCIPFGDAHPDELSITMPVAKDLIRIQGTDRASRAHHVRIDGLAFAETDGVSPTRFWWQFQWGKTGHAMIWLRNTNHIEVTNCHLKNSGRNGIMMVGENTHNTVSGCWVEQMGVNGITLSNRSTNAAHNGPTPDELKHNTLTNNRVHDVGQLSIYNACVNLMNGSHNEVSYSEFFNSPRYATTMRGNSNAQKGPPAWHPNFPSARGNHFHHLRVHHCGQDSGDMGPIHTATLNIPGGDCINTFEQITIVDTKALPSMKDIPPDGIFLDWPKRSMHQVFHNVQVVRAQGLQFRTNGPDNKTSTVVKNVSWESDFDERPMEYDRIGVQASFPAAYGGPPPPLSPLPQVTISAAAKAYNRVELTWALPAGTKTMYPPRFTIRRNDLTLTQTENTALVDTDVSELTTYRYEITARDGDFGPGGSQSSICEVQTPADRTAPRLVATAPTGNLERLVLRFSEPVTPSAVEPLANFRVTPEVTVTQARPGVHPDGIVLSVAGLQRSQTYRLQVTGVTDCAVARNQIATDASLAFTADFLLAHLTPDQSAAAGGWKLQGEAEWTEDGTGLRLDGRDSCAEGPPELNIGAEDFALAAWLWKERGGSAIVIAKGNGFGAPDEWSWGWEDPQGARNIAFRSQNRYYSTAPGSLPAETWTHIAFVKKGEIGNTYVNGEISGGPHDLSQLESLANSHPLLIGRRLHEPTPAWFPGRIADLRLYTRSLSQDEVQALAAKHPGQ